MLLSFAFNRTTDIGKYRDRMPCGRLMIDSGAFTAHTTGKPIQLAEYEEFLTRWRGVFDHAVTLDVVGDPVATRKNTHWLHQRGHNVMPVFTRGGSSADFDAMVKDSGYVCVGGGVGMNREMVIARLSALQRRAEELGGGIHALGVGNLNGLRKIRPYSADASNVSAAFIYGNVVCYDGRRLRSFPHTDRAKVRAHLVDFRNQGLGSQLAELLRTGRQPMGKARIPFMQGMAMSWVCADEDTTEFTTPVPHGITDSPGTHLYMAVTGGFLSPAVAELDTLVHSEGWTVPIWPRYRAKHQRQCRVKVAA